MCLVLTYSWRTWKQFNGWKNILFIFAIIAVGVMMFLEFVKVLPAINIFYSRETEGVFENSFIKWSCNGCFQRPYAYIHVPHSLCLNAENTTLNLDAVFLMPSRAIDSRQRRLIRHTTLSFTHNNTHPSTRHVFLVGASPNSTVQRHLAEEVKTYGDVLQQDFVDSYDNLTLKTLVALEWTIEYCPNVRWVVKIDSDVYLNLAYLTAIQQSINDTDYLFGYCFQNLRPMRRTENPAWKKIVIPTETYSFVYFPPFCGGPLYMLSINVTRAILNVSPDTPYFKLEDVYLGLCLLKTNYTIQTIPYFHGHHMVHPVVLNCSFAFQHVAIPHLAPEELRDGWARCST